MMMKFLFGRKKMIGLILAGVLTGSVLAITVLAWKGSPGREELTKNRGTAQEAKDPDVVSLPPEKLGASGIEVAKVLREPDNTPLMATAAIELNADKTSRVSSRVTGRIMRTTVSQGDRVKAGQPLAFIDTVELDQIWAEYRKNKGRYELARKNLKREEALFEQKVAPEKDMLKARQDLSEAEADLTFAKERFRLLGIDVGALRTTQNGDAGNRPLIPIVSSVGGVVIEKAVTQGEVVSPEKPLFVVADISTLWVLVDIYEIDMAKLKAGAVVNVSVNAFPHKVFRGKISYIGDVVGERTRTVKARVTIDNSEGSLKPGMFAAVSIDAETGAAASEVIAIPEEAILVDGSDRYVFVKVGEGLFKRKNVVLGRSLGKKVEAVTGLREGDVLVVKGTFPVKSEYKKQSLKVE
ncbi:MAG TPA: efflux RND transporter periplasmic adaptor subunit [Syntrophorhabdaceae bacterium]|jgi:cobalt-zinc-cadmium efflux system membrane fusion protein